MNDAVLAQTFSNFNSQLATTDGTHFKNVWEDEELLFL